MTYAVMGNLSTLQHRESSMSFKTMDDGQVLLYGVSSCIDFPFGGRVGKESRYS